MNVPNCISVFRVLLIPIIVILLLVPVPDTSKIVINSYKIVYTWLIAGILFILAAVSDFFDGYLARKLRQVTAFGKFFDSIADKLLSTAILITMSYLNVIPIWITLMLVLRDFLIDGVRQVLATKNVIMAANWYGKWKYTFTLIGLTIAFFCNTKNFVNFKPSMSYFNHVFLLPLYIAVVLSMYSASIYIYRNHKLLFNLQIKEK